MTNEATRIRELEGIKEASQATGCTNLLIITNDEEGEITETDVTIQIIPAWKWLLTYQQ